MDLGSGLGHLTYSTLVHPGDTWEEMWQSLTSFVPKVKARVAPDRRFGVSLRISGVSSRRLAGDPAERQKLKAFLDDNDMYLYTVNAFPHGPFKNTVVKTQVYEPDWRSDERAEYTMRVADILAEVAPPGIEPSIQTAPLGYKPRVTGNDVVEAYTRQVLRVAAHLVELERRTGRCVTLAIEPEPDCYLETTTETLAYFKEHLYSGAAAAQLAHATGLAISDAHARLRRHIGTVYDICHQAVEYEDIKASLQALVDAGIPVFKLQEAAAMRMPEVDGDIVEALRPYANSVYLTQTVERRNGRLTRFPNLEDAFAAWQREPGPREWRTHFHVPVFLDDLGAFKTTRFAIEDALAFQKAHGLSAQLEIETYTWDVLPDHLKTGDIVDYVSREIEWVRGQLI
ncbi:MAG: metabolite traffic protein EboE [Alphaproteobacteria bacterium]